MYSLTGLVLLALTRKQTSLYIAMAIVFTGQIGDALAGIGTDVNVFITYIAFALTALQVLLLTFGEKYLEKIVV